MLKLLLKIFLTACPLTLLAISDAHFEPIQVGNVGKTYKALLEVHVPTGLSEHLMWHYYDDDYDHDYRHIDPIERFYTKFEEDYEGYPLLDSDGSFSESAVKYWIEKHAEAYTKIYESSKKDSYKHRLRKLKVSFDHSYIREEKGQIVVPYVFEFKAKENTEIVTDDLKLSVPKNLVQTFIELMGLKKEARNFVEGLKDDEWPDSDVRRERLLFSEARHLGCFEKRVRIWKEHIYTNDFVEGLLLGAGCDLDVGFLTTPKIEEDSRFAPNEVYPDYNRLIVNGEMKVLFMPEKALEKSFDVSFELVEKKSKSLSVYAKEVNGVKVTLTLFEPESFMVRDDLFWDLYEQNNLVVVESLPIGRHGLHRIASDQYHLLLKDFRYYYRVVGEPGVLWGASVPNSDYTFNSFDLLRTKEPNLEDLNKLVELVTRGEGPDFEAIMLGVQGKDKAIDAFFIAQNGQESFENDFEVLNQAGLKENSRFEQAFELMTLKYDVQTIYDNLFVDARDKVFFKNTCKPRFLLANGRDEIAGHVFPKGSRVVMRKNESLKEITLSENYQWGDFLLKANNQEGGRVYFHSNGKIKQAHLAQNTQYGDFLLFGGRGASTIRFFKNGVLKDAQLRKPANFNGLTMKGGTRGPHKITFHESGELKCAYLLEPGEINGIEIGFDVYENSTRTICFHKDGTLLHGRLAYPQEINSVLYPKGKISFNQEGEVESPVMRPLGDDDAYEEQVFPRGSTVAEGRYQGTVMLGGKMEVFGWKLEKGDAVRMGYKQINSIWPLHRLTKGNLTIEAGSELRFLGQSKLYRIRTAKPITFRGIKYLPFEGNSWDDEHGKIKFNDRDGALFLEYAQLAQDLEVGPFVFANGTNIYFGGGYQRHKETAMSAVLKHDVTHEGFVYPKGSRIDIDKNNKILKFEKREAVGNQSDVEL